MFDEKGNIIKEDKIFTRVDIEPILSAGKKAFQDYVTQNTDKDVPTLRAAPKGRYLAVINFVVDANGRVTDIKNETVNGYGIEEQAIRVIKNSLI